MLADIFYESRIDKARTIILLKKDEMINNESLTNKTKLILEEQQFYGKCGDIAMIMGENGLVESIYLGTGDEQQTRALACAATKIPPGCYILNEDVADEALLSWSLAQYQFNKFKQTTKKPRVLVINENKLKKILHKANSIFLVRDLINLPANKLGPKELADITRELANENDANFQEWVGDELLDDNFEAIYTVGKASESKPRLATFTWGNPEHPRISLVGKGVCFDSGGLDIKPADGMRIMKKDMGGAANVLGLAKWIMLEKLPVFLHVLIPAVENSISNNAYRPGDVLTMRNGMTVEIENTDAEGRLVLADAMVKACEYNPDILIDFATLTGAARIAVGTDISAMFSNNDELAEDLLDAGKQVSEPICRLPLFPGYKSLFDSSIADMANSSKSSYAGAIIAALFLENYVSKGVKWAHFDIMAWNLSDSPGKPAGGEALGIMTVARYLERKYKNNN